jgi:hypothetical protein
MSLTCKDCSVNVDCGHYQLGKREACDRIKPHEFSKPVEDSNGGCPGVIRFVHNGDSIKYSVQYPLKSGGFKETEPITFKKLNSEVIDSMTSLFCDHCDVKSRGYVANDIEEILKELQDKPWYPKKFKTDDRIQTEVKDEYADLVDISNSGKVSLSSGTVADYITRKLSVISYKETLYTYSEGYYKEGSETIKALIIKIVRETGAKVSIREITRDVLHYIMYNDPFTEYPFNFMFGYVPFKNGVAHLDFESNAIKLVEHDPKYRFNWQIPHDFDPSNTGDVIHKLMIEKYVSDDEQPILYQVPAQAILQAMGVRPYKKGYLFDGPANAGKTTMTDLYEVAFGVSNVSHQSLQALNTTENKFSIACLEGKLLNCYDDLSNIPLKDSGTFKTITGKEWHDIEKKGQQQYSARLFAVHVFTCNAPPMFDSKIKKDHAFWERWEYVHFPKTFAKDPLFYDRVFTEENISGFLHRVLKTCIDIYNNGLYVNSTVEEVREKWSFNSDPIYRYLDEHVEQSTRCDYVDKADLLSKIKAWALKNGADIDMIPLSVKALTTRLELYDVVADKKVNAEGVRVEVYRLNGVLSEEKGLHYLPKKIAVKTQQGGLN